MSLGGLAFVDLYLIGMGKWVFLYIVWPTVLLFALLNVALQWHGESYIISQEQKYKMSLPGERRFVSYSVFIIQYSFFDKHRKCPSAKIGNMYAGGRKSVYIDDVFMYLSYGGSCD